MVLHVLSGELCRVLCGTRSRPQREVAHRTLIAGARRLLQKTGTVPRGVSALPCGAEAGTVEEGTRPRSDAMSRRGCVPNRTGPCEGTVPVSARHGAVQFPFSASFGGYFERLNRTLSVRSECVRTIPPPAASRLPCFASPVTRDPEPVARCREREQVVRIRAYSAGLAGLDRLSRWRENCL